MSKSGSSVVHNVIDVLNCFSTKKGLLGVTEIAEEVGLHKSSVSRLLSTLEEKGWVEQEAATRKYRLGLGLIGIAGPLLANLDVRELAYPYLSELAERTQETAVLTVWNAEAAVTVEQIVTDRTVKHTSPLGARYTSTSSATVKVFLASMDPEQVKELINLEKLSTAQDFDFAQYLDELREVRSHNIATNIRATFDDEVGIAAPVYDHRGSLVAAVLIAAPAYRIDDDQIKQLISECLQTSSLISTRLGYSVSTTNEE